MTIPQDPDYKYTEFIVNTYPLKIASPQEEVIDPLFFEPSFDLAAATGFSIWEGALGILTFLKSPEPEADKFRQCILNAKVVELGSGTGIAGLCVAAYGGHVLLTDVECVVPFIQKNINLNRKEESLSSKGWLHGVNIGKGSATMQVLDWKLPLETQIHPNDPHEATILMATETAWLKSLAPFFVNTVAHFLHSSPATKCCYWAYKERGTAQSECFTTETELLDLFQKADCKVKVVFRLPSKEDVAKFITINVITSNQ